MPLWRFNHGARARWRSRRHSCPTRCQKAGTVRSAGAAWIVARAWSGEWRVAASGIGPPSGCSSTAEVGRIEETGRIAGSLHRPICDPRGLLRSTLHESLLGSPLSATRPAERQLSLAPSSVCPGTPGRASPSGGRCPGAQGGLRLRGDKAKHQQDGNAEPQDSSFV